jgi:hypothetical protein
MTQFRTRRMEFADEAEFNEIYNGLVIGIRKTPRPLEVMRHIWHAGPGGPVHSWIVEAKTGPGNWKIIAHHGLCPIRYTMGDQDFLFAKTVNSFLIPEYRNKFLYLRFEKRCLAEVENLLDATFTLAAEATRMRAALGYETDIPELDLERGLQPVEIASRVLIRLASRYPMAIAPLARRWSNWHALGPELALNDLDSGAAISSLFFRDFWSQTRVRAGLAPRRDAADLAWRFWNMPEERTTLIHEGREGIQAYCILRRANSFHFLLEDIFLSRQEPELLLLFLKAIFAWCGRNGGLMISFMTTADGQSPVMLEVYRRNMGKSLSWHHRDNHMSRKLTARGLARLGPAWPPCNVTPMVAMA